jgi:uncharacterized damage-inducible protein DinB
MLAEILKIYERDLTRLEMEITAFNSEENLWRITGSVKNAAGNLCLHLIGNLNTYIGRDMGGMNYIRDRDAEFSSKNIPLEKLIEQVRATRKTVLSSLSRMKPENLDALFKDEVLGYSMTNGFFLIHLTAHLSYHLGQINYLRRILE